MRMRMRMKQNCILILSAIGISLAVTAASYFIDTGCSCGPALGFPFSYVHPLTGCTTGAFVVGADQTHRFGPVFDIGSVVYDLVIWGVVGYFILRKITNVRTHEPAADV